MDAFLANDLGLVHFLHSINFLSFLETNAPYLTKSSLSDDIDAVKVIAAYLFTVRFFGGLLSLGLFEFGEVYFEAVLHVPVGFLGYCGVATVVFLLLLLRHLPAFTCAVLHLRPPRHRYANRTIDACLPGLDGCYRECVEESCCGCTGILMGSTLGRLPR